jgi:hypothetical protein
VIHRAWPAWRKPSHLTPLAFSIPASRWDIQWRQDSHILVHNRDLECLNTCRWACQVLGHRWSSLAQCWASVYHQVRYQDPMRMRYNT